MKVFNEINHMPTLVIMLNFLNTLEKIQLNKKEELNFILKTIGIKIDYIQFQKEINIPSNLTKKIIKI